MHLHCFSLPRASAVHCKIVLLDETVVIQEIKPNYKGQDILEPLFKHFGFFEPVYFGLRYVNAKGVSCWLDPKKNVHAQVAGVDPVTFYFGVKFYASDPCKLMDEATRYQFFLQVKQDIQQSRLVVTTELAAQLTAYLIQSELGDYDSRTNQPGYVSEFRLIASPPADFEVQVRELHKKLIGQIPSSVELQFLERIKWLDLYGCELHSVVADDTSDYYIGISPHGLIVLKNKFKVGIYFWTRIRKIIYKSKYFMIKVIDKNNEKSTYGFEMPDKSAAKHIYKSCEEHQKFFNLSVNEDRQGNKPGDTGTLTTVRAASAHNAARPTPALVRVPSRRYQRMGRPDGQDYKETEGDGAPGGQLQLSGRQDGLSRHNSTPSLHPLPHPSAHPVLPHPYHTLQHPSKSTTTTTTTERGMFSRTATASPLSVRSAFVSRYDYGRANYVSHMTRNLNTTLSTLSLSSKNATKNVYGGTVTTNISDNESNVSKSSRHSRRSSRSHRSSSRNGRHQRQHSQHSEDSGTECSTLQQQQQLQSQSSRRHRRSRRKHSAGSKKTPELVNWDNIVERKQQTLPSAQQDDESYGGGNTVAKQSNAVVKNVASYVGGQQQHHHGNNNNTTGDVNLDGMRYTNEAAYRRNILPAAAAFQQSLPRNVHLREGREFHQSATTMATASAETPLIQWDSVAYYNHHKNDRKSLATTTSSTTTSSRTHLNQQQQQSRYHPPGHKSLADPYNGFAYDGQQHQQSYAKAETRYAQDLASNGLLPPPPASSSSAHFATMPSGPVGYPKGTGTGHDYSTTTYPVGDYQDDSSCMMSPGSTPRVTFKTPHRTAYYSTNVYGNSLEHPAIGGGAYQRGGGGGATTSLTRTYLPAGHKSGGGLLPPASRDNIGGRSGQPDRAQELSTEL